MTPPVKPFRVIPCAEWGARPPKSSIPRVGKPNKALFHHTAGHVPNLSAGETYAEACAYARAIQKMHMAPGGLGAPQGGIDSGHNLLITRGGFILEGRHGSVAAIDAGKMVASAHCPNQNDQPGTEIEHNGNEAMTPIQREAAIWAFAWICKSCIIPATHIYGHRDFYATSCPGVLYARLPQFRVDVSAALKTPAPISSSYEIHLTGETGHTETVKARKSLVLIADGKKHHLFDEKIVSFNGVRLESG
jgi:hypothetical protein